jgi:hypothetical protein
MVRPTNGHPRGKTLDSTAASSVVVVVVVVLVVDVVVVVRSCLVCRRRRRRVRGSVNAGEQPKGGEWSTRAINQSISSSFCLTNRPIVCFVCVVCMSCVWFLVESWTGVSCQRRRFRIDPLSVATLAIPAVRTVRARPADNMTNNNNNYSLCCNDDDEQSTYVHGS